MREHLCLIDGSGFIFRAYHSLPPLTRKDGMPIGAVSGFCNMLHHLIRTTHDDFEPTHLALIFDAPGKTFRNEIYPEYKGQRSATPDDLKIQFSLVRRAVTAFSVPRIELDGFEADDLIATYARLARETGMKVTIVSSDKDLMQLVRDDVQMLDTLSKWRKIGRAEVLDKFGVQPERVIDVQALAGDAVDNVPGIPSIGIKTGAALIREYGDLETLLENAHTIKQPARRENLIRYAEQARLSKKLVTLADNVPITVTIDGLRIQPLDEKRLFAFLSEMELQSLLETVDQTAVRAAHHAGKKPSDLIAAYEPWCRRIAGEQVAAHVDDPEPGFYRTRLVKGGPWVGVAIWLHQDIDPETGELAGDEHLRCVVDGVECDPVRYWNFAVGNPITEEDYRAMDHRGARARALAPTSPFANPRRASSVADLPPMF